jgi:hypothetical protein
LYDERVYFHVLQVQLGQTYGDALDQVFCWFAEETLGVKGADVDLGVAQGWLLELGQFGCVIQRVSHLLERNQRFFGVGSS